MGTSLYKSNRGFCLVELCHLILEYILKCTFLAFWGGGANELSLAVYFICILDHGNDVRQKATFSNFLVGVQNGF